MIKFNKNQRFSLIFPENSALIIKSILEKYNLLEPNKELLEKWKKNKKGRGEILADLVIKMTETDLSVSDLTNLTKKELDIDTQKAQKIIEDLNEKIIIPAIQISEKALSEKEPSPREEPKIGPEKKAPENLRPKTKDSYRESIE